jgi:hypothetical protein
MCRSPDGEGMPGQGGLDEGWVPPTRRAREDTRCECLVGLPGGLMGLSAQDWERSSQPRGSGRRRCGFAGRSVQHGYPSR